MRRGDWRIWPAAVMCLVFAVTGCGSSGDESGSESERQPVEVDLEVAEGDKAMIALSGAVEAEVRGQTASLFAYRDRQEVRLTSGGVGDECDSVNLQVVFPIAEGETGTYASVKTPQFTCKSTQYLASSPVRMTVETYSDGTFAAALEGTFDQVKTTGGKEKAEEALEVEGRFEFGYGE